ncbi:hypothetical protein [Rhizobium leguminosarum]|uniref:hypothetical protein n=1 Tax=Rhizobium leguminosarum TaxID=384 RepID=UPI001030BCD2|nr:hypothetical protein [Rhizobium leguminosarum]TAX29816.1 hypothetical protein ELI04_08605 [Rhizobium leguminosarum]
MLPTNGKSKDSTAGRSADPVVLGELVVRQQIARVARRSARPVFCEDGHRFLLGLCVGLKGLRMSSSSPFSDDLRDQVAAKIACGAAHFNALAVDLNPARYVKATRLDDVLNHA